MNQFEALRQTRNNILRIAESMSLEQLNTIPSGFNNSILWNIGHVLVTQQALNYRLSGLPMHIDSAFIDRFKKGSSASEVTEQDWAFIKSKFTAMIDQLEEDMKQERFQTFQEYPTSYGIVLNSIDDAIGFNGLHEALHLGYIMAQRRAVLG